MFLQFIYQPIPIHHVEVSAIMTRQSMANNLTVLYISEKGPSQPNLVNVVQCFQRRRIIRGRMTAVTT